MTRLPSLDPGLAVLREAAAARGRAPLSEVDPAEARRRGAEGDRLCAAGPRSVDVVDAVVAHAGHRVPVRTYGSGARTLVYAHGGGWVTGDLAYADEVCRFLAAEGIRVVSVDYRLAPEHPFPAALDDVLAVVRHERRTSTGAVAIAGDSAGANLAAAAALELRASADAVDFQVLVYPALDHDHARGSYRDDERAFPIGAADMEWFLGHYVPEELREDPRVWPLRAQDHSGLPRTHVVVAGYDPLHDEGVAFVARLAAAGVDVTIESHPSLCHGFLRFTGASAAAVRARDRLVRTVDELFGPPTAAAIS